MENLLRYNWMDRCYLLKTSMIIMVYTLMFLLSCSTAKRAEKRLSPEERTVYELIEKLKVNPGDRDAAHELQNVYDDILYAKESLSVNSYLDGNLGDRWMKLGYEYAIMQKIYNAIKAVPAAEKAVPNVRNFAGMEDECRRHAAEEYYVSGIQYLNYNNRPYARKALEMFDKADRAVKGYKDVSNLRLQARDMATLKVIVQSVDYHNYGWSHWGFQNDWLQQRMVQDLNAMSFNDVRFYSEWEAQSRRIQADRLVTMRLVDLYISNVNTVTNTYNRSAQVETGATTKNIPAKPVYKTIYARVTVTKRTMVGRSILECRIYSTNSGYIVLSDRYPGNYTWESSSATYTGDYKALTAEDIRVINNRFPPVPSRTEVAEKIIYDSYNLLLNRIRSGVTFGD